MTRDVIIPGVVYDDYLNPNATSMQAELGLPIPESRKFGRGRQYIYRQVAGATARELGEYLLARAGNLLHEEPDMKDVHRNAIEVATRILRVGREEE